MGTFSLRQQAAYTVLLFSLLLLLLPRDGHEGDLNCWSSWAAYIFDHGLGNVYQVPSNNYNPLYHYVLWGFGKLAGSQEKIQHYRPYLKVFTLLFDFAGAFWAASLVRERERRFGLALLLLFNIGYLYNTLVWVQVDAIYTFFAFGAVMLAVQQRAVGSVCLFVLALMAKTQAIIFLPPLLLLWVPLWARQPLRLAQAVGAGAILTTLVLAPFIWFSYENYVPRIIEINRTAAEVYPRLSMQAYNIWYLIAGNPFGEASDLQPFGGLTYRAWGLLWFFAASALALWPLLLATLRRLRRPVEVGPDGALPAGADPTSYLALALLSCGLIPILFAYFNTQMHERYWHAAILFLAAYGFVRRDYVPYVLASVAYFLNLESVLGHLGLLKYSAIYFRAWFVAVLFALIMLLIIYKLYRLSGQRADWRMLRQSVGSRLAVLN